MKKLAMFFSLAILVGSCGGGSSDSDLSSTSFSSVAQQTLPVLNSSSAGSASINVVPSFTNGDMNYELYKLLGDPALSTAETWGVENLYNNLDLADSAISGLKSSCQTAINKQVSPAFDFGLTPETYTCANSNSMVWNISDTFIKILLSYQPSGSDHLELFNMLAAYDSTTKDLTMDIVSYNSYEAADSPSYTGTNTGKFISRSEVRGNTDAHSFTIRTIKRNPGAGPGGTDGYELDMVGKGVSKGTGNYFLLKVKDNQAVPTDTYYCIPADVTEDQIKALVGTDYAGVDANCSAYKADVQAMDFFNETTEIPLTKFDTTLVY